jgi:hypothetical protein
MSPASIVTFEIFAASMRDCVSFTVSAFMSTPVTLPEGPTIDAASSETSPAPQPTSSTRMPGPRPASLSVCAVRSPKNAACLISRSISLAA